jgi:hypothetical protein
MPRVARAVPRAEPVFDESERNLVERGRPQGGPPAPRGGSGAGHPGKRAVPRDAAADRGWPQSLRRAGAAR